MNITRKDREYLGELSLVVFGSKSAWQDVVAKGRIVPKLNTKGQIIPNTYTRIQPTVESAREFMLEAVDQITKRLQEDSNEPGKST